MRACTAGFFSPKTARTISVLIAHVLRKAGADVAVVENGQLAVDAAMDAQNTSDPFDVILMDMQMPVMERLCGHENSGDSGGTRGRSSP